LVVLVTRVGGLGWVGMSVRCFGWWEGVVCWVVLVFYLLGWVIGTRAGKAARD
jgi:hypothetical protein